MKVIDGIGGICPTLTLIMGCRLSEERMTLDKVHLHACTIVYNYGRENCAECRDGTDVEVSDCVH